MKRMLIAGAFALAAGGQALAADLPQPAPPPPRAPAAYLPIVPVFTWSGIYIGANGGYSWGKITPTAPPGVSSFNANGIVAGGTIGGNIQTGAFVFGAEGDFDWDNIKGTPRPASVARLPVLGWPRRAAASVSPWTAFSSTARAERPSNN